MCSAKGEGATEAPVPKVKAKATVVSRATFPVGVSPAIPRRSDLVHAAMGRHLLRLLLLPVLRSVRLTAGRRLRRRDKHLRLTLTGMPQNPRQNGLLGSSGVQATFQQVAVVTLRLTAVWAMEPDPSRLGAPRDPVFLARRLAAPLLVILQQPCHSSVP